MDHKIAEKQLRVLSRACTKSASRRMAEMWNLPEKDFFRFIDKNPFFSDNSVNAIYEYIFSTHKSRFGYEIVFENGINNFTNQFISLN